MKSYTLEEANANVDLIQKTFNHVGTLHKLIRQLKITYLYVVLWQSKGNHNSYSNKDNELDIKQLEVKSIIRKIENLVEPIIERGIIVRDIKQGLVDIPSIKERCMIYLCWLSGEPEVRFWHGINVGFSDSQLI